MRPDEDPEKDSDKDVMAVVLNKSLPVKDMTLAYLESIVKIYDVQIDGLNEERQNLLNMIYKIRESIKKK